MPRLTRWTLATMLIWVTVMPGSAQSGRSNRERWPSLRAPADLGSPYVPLDSWIYAVVDRLAAMGYAPSAFAGLRPWTRMECVRIVENMGELLTGEDGSAGESESLYRTLRREFAADLERGRDPSRPEVKLERIYSRYTSISGTPLADGYHFGQTLMNDFGRPYGQGANVIGGASTYATKGPLAFYVRGEYQHAAALAAYSSATQQMIGLVDGTPPQLPIHTTATDRGRLLDAYVAFNLRSVQVSVGRQSLWWGPGRGGPLMYSNNAQPMDMIRLTKTSPWRLPGFFSWLGPVRWEFFVGRMAGHHYPANAAIDGQKVSFKPTPNLEFGFSRTIVFSPLTAGKFWRGFTSTGSNRSDVPGAASDAGDRRGGFDFSYRIPGLRKWLTVYNDSLTDDDPLPLATPRRAMMNPGIYLPQFPGIPKLDLRVETPFSDTPAIVRRSGHFFYWNGAYRDSYTNAGNLLGSWVGRQGHGVQVWSTYWFSPRKTLQVGYREARVDREFIPSGGRIQDFSLRADWPLASGIDFSAFVQHERWSFPSLSPLTGPNTVASIQLTYHPAGKAH